MGFQKIQTEKWARKRTRKNPQKREGSAQQKNKVGVCKGKTNTPTKLKRSAPNPEK